MTVILIVRLPGKQVRLLITVAGNALGLCIHLNSNMLIPTCL